MNPAFLEWINKSEYTFADVTKNVHEKLPDIVPQDLSGKVYIVTGANAGVGFETAKSIASMKPALLILACRNQEKGKEALAAIQKETGFTKIEVETLDLASYDSTKAFAKRFLQRDIALDVLVSNAGVSATGWVLTKDGNEITIQVNHLSNVLLILLLTPALRKAPHARVVVVASDTHFWALRPEPTDPHPIKTILTKSDIHMIQYTSSKLMNVLFAIAYAEKCPYHNIFVCSSNPGYTESELGLKNPETGGDLTERQFNGLKQRTTYEGAKTIIHSAISTDTNQNGAFHSEMRVNRTRSTTQGEVGKKFADNVWKETIEILQKVVEPGTFEAWVEK